ncbi:MAG: hypothetical protein ACRDVG_04785 [Jatrophihabitantaceae bacterium]
MTSLIVILVFLAIWAAAAIVSIRDPKPARRPPEWSMGRVIQPRH